MAMRKMSLTVPPALFADALPGIRLPQFVIDPSPTNDSLLSEPRHHFISFATLR